MARRRRVMAMRLFSVDPGEPFLERLAEGFLAGAFGTPKVADDPFALSGAVVYLPTRRAARALASAFIDKAGGPTILPRIETLGESDDEEDESRPEVIDPFDARLTLARLIMAFAASRTDGSAAPRVATGADAIRLADELLRLMDQVETQEADWADLPALVADADLAAHWQITTDFLQIATEQYPHILSAQGVSTPGAARRRAADMAVRRLGERAGPVVVAGSTGSLPATRRLIGAIARHAKGSVVLPGLDRLATAADWQRLASAADGPSHPQYGMFRLLDELGAHPRDVAPLCAPDLAGNARRALMSAALRPAAATDAWTTDRTMIDFAAAFDTVALVEAEDERAEAAAVAVAMREAVAHGRSVALVTPHRTLARRVSIALRRFGMRVDDSGGKPLATTPAGIFARLVAVVGTGAASAAEWLAFLKHPLGDAANDPGGVRAIEAVFREGSIAPEEVARALALKNGAAATLAERVFDGLAPLGDLSGRQPVGTLAAAHLDAITALLAPADTETADKTALLGALKNLSRQDQLDVAAADWPQTFDALTAGIGVREAETDAAVTILGPLEARLQSFGHVVLGGLNEGVWPQAAEPGPWMSRGMMTAFGLDLPERRIGLSAHDFAIAAHTTHLTMTRALKAGGAPTVAARWWQRLDALAGPSADAARARGRRLGTLARALDTKPAVPPAPRPAPRPPVSARPTTFSVTEVGRLVRDPYAFYARRILNLKPLDPLDADPSFAERGELVHRVLARFAEQAGGSDEQERIGLFRAIAAEALKALRHAPQAQALWGARLDYIAPFVCAFEAERGKTFDAIAIEAPASATIDGATLKGRIDRIDRDLSGALSVVDYKTGSAPSAKEVLSLLEPQLPLEAALASLGAVEGIAAATPVAELAYIEIARGREPLTFRPAIVTGKTPLAGKTAEEATADVQASFAGLVRRYADPQTPYLSRARIKFEAEVSGDYDHLARTREWLG